MIKLKMLNQIKPDLILEILLNPDQIATVQKDVKIFYTHKHNLPHGVLNAILLLSIITTGDNLFNQAYLRKVAETFKAEGITTVSLAVMKLEKDYEQAMQRNRKSTMKVSEPDWMPEILESFKMN